MNRVVSARRADTAGVAVGGGGVGASHAPLTIRKARVDDIPRAHAVINGYARQGLMLRRPLVMLYEGLRDFVIAMEDGRLVGVGGLHVMWNDLAEIRALAVAPERRRRGVGRRLVEYMLGEARDLGIARVFALTYQQPFFEACGFSVVDKECLPQKVWKECIYCDRFENCDETAVIKHLDIGGAPRGR